MPPPITNVFADVIDWIEKSAPMPVTVALAVASHEDVILSQLEWSRLGGSTRQLEDVAALLSLRSSDIDRAYLEHWVRELEVGNEWDAATAIWESRGRTAP